MINKNQFNLKQSKKINVCGIPFGFEGHVINTISEENKNNIIYIAKDDKDAEIIKNSLFFFNSKIKVINFPAWDCLPYDRSGPRLKVQSERLTFLSKLCQYNSYKKIIITTVNAITQRVIPKTHLEKLNFKLTVGKSIDIVELKNFLIHSGYIETGKVLELGDFSIRGGIIDIFPSSFENPIRLDFFGDNLENARYFDIEDQRSIKEILEPITIFAVREVCLNKLNIAHFKKNYLKNFGMPENIDHLYNSIISGQVFPGYEHWISFFYNTMDTIFDYVVDPILIIPDHFEDIFEMRSKTITDYFQLRNNIKKKTTKFNSVYNPVDSKLMYIDFSDWEKITSKLAKVNFFEFNNLKIKNLFDYKGSISKNFTIERQTDGLDLFENVVNYIKNLLNKNNIVAIATYSRGALERLEKLFIDYGLKDIGKFQSCNYNTFKNHFEFIPENKNLCLGILPIEQGFSVPGLVVISEQDILGSRLYRQKKYNKKIKNPLQNFSEINIGDLVVHVDHGIGKYTGFKSIFADKIPHDCLIIEYAGGDKLFLPIENLNVLSKYGQEFGELDKLGSLAWQNKRSKAKKRIKEMAHALIAVAAKRYVNKGTIHNREIFSWNKFCSGFQFEETEDQNLAISEILKDLSSGSPMDRLICGDVGFGKTEIALRASMIVSNDGYQVALLAPTTLLARQHYETFRNRFKEFPIFIEKLTRFENLNKRKKIIEKLKTGKVDIIIGTHSLLSSEIQFKNLGLLIIDEEQHFGVSHKETMKKFKANIHVLTLTATPIPRTLQLAMSGVRDFSIINTPPIDRLLVRTFVMEFDGVVIREALLREKSRGGQSFFVVPRVSDMTFISDYLKSEVPEINFTIAHGQLSGSNLDNVIFDFISNKTDLLLSTSIVESGLDFPNANTLIVHRANMFGLSQLYQIRGRVGRSKIRAYCYLTYEKKNKITKQGEKRLKILANINSLGQGFSLASQDLDIRGAGNLLGEEQSGEIREVGYELYQSMLKDEIDKIKDKQLDVIEEINDFIPQIDLNVPMLIPDNYVKDLVSRLSLYRELAILKTDVELSEFSERIIDRFGSIPYEVDILIKVSSIKNVCISTGINLLKVGQNRILVGFHENKFSNPKKLMEFIKKNDTFIKVKEDKIVIKKSFENNNKKLEFIKMLVKNINSMKKTPSGEGASY